MKKKELIEELNDLKDRIKKLEEKCNEPREEQSNTQRMWKLIGPGKYIAKLIDDSHIECAGGCQIPTHYYSQDGKYPCVKCGRTIQCSYITYETQ